MSYSNYKDIENAIANFREFTGNSCQAMFNSDGVYMVYSYRTVIATANPKTGGVAINSRKYSNTTSRLQNIIRRAWVGLVVSELD